MELAGRQFNRVSRSQLVGLGLTQDAIDHRIAIGRLVIVEQGVFAVAPVLSHDPWGRWMGATLTAPESFLSHECAAVAWECLNVHPRLLTVTRPGDGGPRRHGGILAYRSTVLTGETTQLRGIPITTPPRTLLDLARTVSERALARAVREAVRLERTTLGEVADAVGRHRRRRGTRRLMRTVAKYRGLPLQRARSGAEVRALEVLHEAGRSLPNLNHRIAGEEADLSWPALRLIIEVDGKPFHLDRGNDRRKREAWERAGWTVRRIDSNDVYRNPGRLLDLTMTVPQSVAERGTKDVL